MTLGKYCSRLLRFTWPLKDILNKQMFISAVALQDCNPCLHRKVVFPAFTGTAHCATENYSNVCRMASHVMVTLNKSSQQK